MTLYDLIRRIVNYYMLLAYALAQLMLAAVGYVYGPWVWSL